MNFAREWNFRRQRFNNARIISKKEKCTLEIWSRIFSGHATSVANCRKSLQRRRRRCCYQFNARVRCCEWCCATTLEFRMVKSKFQIKKFSLEKNGIRPCRFASNETRNEFSKNIQPRTIDHYQTTNSNEFQIEFQILHIQFVPCKL